MKKFAFSLQKLLNYREQVFDTEIAVLGDMRSVLNRMMRERDELQQEHNERSASFNEKIRIGTTAQEIELHKMYMRIVDYNIEQKIKQIEMQKLAIEKQQDKVREAKIEINTMEKLREKKLEEYNYVAGKAEELFIDEFVNNAKASMQQS